MNRSPFAPPLTIDALLTRHGQPHRKTLRRAATCAAVAAASAVALLEVSGWFLAAAAGAGVAGIAAAQAFNYLLPSAAVRLLAILRTASRYGERLLGHDAALRTLAGVRPALFQAVCATPVRRALSLGTGEATAVLMQDVAATEDRLVRRAAPWAAASAVASGVLLTSLAGWAPVASTLLCVLCVALSGRWLNRRAHRFAGAIREATGALKDRLALLAASAPELRCYGLESWAANEAAQDSERLLAAQRRFAFAASWLDLLLAAGTGAAAVLAIAAARGQGAPLAAMAGLASAMALEGLAPLLRHGLAAETAAEAGRRIDGLLASASGTANRGRRVGADASLELPLSPRCRLVPGARVAIVGPSGCGKTTLVETLLGLRPAAIGEIRLGGVDITRLSPAGLRRHFAWLPQDATLIAGSVRENLALAADGLTEAALWSALRDAALYDRVRALPQGLDSWIGEDGALLSGGERRRLALARAYLADAPWLLLDEPTEGLDAATESVVLRGLVARLARSGQGLLVVSHRAAVAAICGEVLRAGAGAVVPKGGGHTGRPPEAPHGTPTRDTCRSPAADHSTCCAGAEGCLLQLQAAGVVFAGGAGGGRAGAARFAGRQSPDGEAG